MKKTVLALIFLSYPLGASENLERLSPSYAGGALQGEYVKTESNEAAGIKLQVGNGKVAGTLDYVNIEGDDDHYGTTNLGFKFKTSGLFGGIEANLHSDVHFQHYGKLEPQYAFHFGYEFTPNMYLMWARDKSELKFDSSSTSSGKADIKSDLVKLGGQMAFTDTVYLTGGIGWHQTEYEVDGRHTSLSDRTESGGTADVGIHYINANGFNVGVDVGYQDEGAVNLVIGRYF
ncbi:hypothetical protein [Vibrio agarivorans]|uniref:hypothetical protein n=1 Tax=Vibrio agarivorans TaxID=153622 RepID=UPI0025B379F1|nr:hypothetical protein [Vibrio agarivorans]MDN3659680.1 hypothetical protein [Vibrio agarivorans]